jgi:hypothetical protein
MGQRQVCCSTRDRNDIEKNLEIRNDRFFYYNHPELIKSIDDRLGSIKDKPKNADLSFLKKSISELLIVIDQSEKNL